MADEQPGGDEPKAVRRMTAWIGGATAVVIALGGLAGAFQNFHPFGSSPAPTATDVPAATAAEPSAAAAADTQPPAYTTGDGGTVKKVDGLWLWTTAAGDHFRYKPVSDDGTTTVALLPGGGEGGKDVYLRWPNAGGQALQSYDDQATWIEPVEFKPEG